MKRLSFIICHLSFSVALLTLTTSCLSNDDPYNAGFFFRKPAYVGNAFFANNLGDTISLMSYGSWTVTRQGTDNSSWCSFTTTSGNGNTLYTFPVTFEQNTTGAGRGVQLYFSDTDHPGDASASIVYWQYATRGDGTLGSAPDVKRITGSDGSLFELTYDGQHRPLLLRVTKDDALVHSLSIFYNDRDSVLTVVDKSKTLTSSYANDYQPQRLIGSGDTIAYSAQYYSNGMPASANSAFNLEHRTILGQNTYYAFLMSGQSLMPDSLHCADSLRIATVTTGQTVIGKYRLYYSENDNRCQSVDVNQLIFGTEQ